MSDNRSFWSTVPGLVTGLAGLLTGIVGLLTVSVQLGWVGGGNGSNANSSTSTSTTSTTVGGTTTTLFGSGPSGSTVGPSGSRFELSPPVLAFAVIGRSEKRLTVRNTGSTPFSVESVTVEGPGAAQFTVDDTECRVADLAPRDSCDVLVTYTSGGASGPATLEVTVSGAEQPQRAELRVGLL